MGVDFWNDPETTDMFHALPPVAGPQGVRHQPYWDPVSQLGGFSFVLFDTAENPAAIFRFADYLLSEYNMFVGHYGIEGIGWNAPEDPNARNIMGGPLKAIPVNLPADAPQEEIDRLNNNRLWLGLIADIFERRAMWTPEPTPEVLRTSYEARIEWETTKTEPYWPDVVLPRSLFMEAEVANEFADLKLNLVSHVLSNTARFITGARSLNEFDAYVSELSRFGMDRYVEIYAEAYDDFLAMSR
jgi:putative aldouronate transport system substrate-binding protein